MDVKNTTLCPNGDHVSFCFILEKLEKRSLSHNARVTKNTDESRRKRRHAASRARRRQPPFFFAAQAGKASLSASFAWAKGALNRHPRNTDGGAAIEVFSASSVFWVYPSVLVLFGRSSCLKNCDSEAPPPGYAVLWFVGVGAAGTPVAIRRGSRFIASIVAIDKSQTADGLPPGCWPSVNMPRQVGSTPQIQFNPIQKKYFWTSSPIGLNRSSLAPKWKRLLGYSFFGQSDPNSIQSNPKN